MLKPLLAALVVAVSGCASIPYRPYIAVETGVRVVNREWGRVDCLEAGQQIRKRTTVAWEHCSDIRRGSPVDDRYDVSHDTLTLRHQWGGQRR